MVLEQFLETLLWSKRFGFCRKYNLKVIPVVKPLDHKGELEIKDKAYTGPGKIYNSKFLDGLNAPEESVIETIKIIEEKKIGKKN